MRNRLADRGLVAEFAASGGFVGFDVKAQRTQAAESATAHLATSKAVFLQLVEKVRSFPEQTAAECIAARDYEALERTRCRRLDALQQPLERDERAHELSVLPRGAGLRSCARQQRFRRQVGD